MHGPHVGERIASAKVRDRLRAVLRFFSSAPVQVIGDYHRDGYAHLKGLIPVEVARAFMQGIKEDMGHGSIPVSRATRFSDVLKRPAFEVYGNRYKPMSFFLWGLTPIASELVGRDLLPTYDYFRIYREGDICRVHADRPACEHSLSLTLDYSDDLPWELEFAREANSGVSGDDFAGHPYGSIPMQVGDAVLYQGVNYAHGRTRPNPNAWSAHLFLHYVDRDGPFAADAFDRQLRPEKVDFSFA